MQKSHPESKASLRKSLKVRHDITIIPGSEGKARTLLSQEPQPCVRHLQSTSAAVVCPFCHEDLLWDAKGAAEVCETPLAPANKAPEVVEALCEKCGGYFIVCSLKTGQLRVSPVGVPDWVYAAEAAAARMEERRAQLKHLGKHEKSTRTEVDEANLPLSSDKNRDLDRADQRTLTPEQALASGQQSSGGITTIRSRLGLGRWLDTLCKIVERQRTVK